VRHRRDYADRARCACKPIVLGGPVASRRSTVRSERADRGDPLQDLVARHDVLPGQLSHVTDGHQFDETHVPGTLNRQAREVLDFVVVRAAQHDDVDLDRRETRCLGRDRSRDRVEAKVTSCDRRDSLGTQRVRAHVHAIEASLPKRPRHLRELRAVGRQRDVLDFRNGLELANQRLEIGTDGRLTAGDSKASQAQRRQLPDDFGDLLVRQDLGLRQPLQPFLRHAIHAAEVAPIRHRDTQVLDAPSPLVAQSRHDGTSSRPPVWATHSLVPSR